MKSTDPSEQWRSLKETYSIMSDDELQAIADEAYDLTDIAKQVLQSEISGRGLSIQLKDKPSEPHSRVRRRDPDVPEMTAIRRAQDLSEVREAPGVQQADGIPSYLRPDPSEQWRRLKETYSIMSEDELQAIADEAYDLTDIAKQALQFEISGRGLTIRLQDKPPSKTTMPHAPASDFNYADSVVRTVYRVRGLPEARKLQEILEAFNIPSCLGPDNLENADAFEPGFEGGVDVKVCDFHMARAQKVLDQHLPPELKEPEDPIDMDEDWTALCPKCHSNEIFFQGGDSEPAARSVSSSQFAWICDACGHQWNDEEFEEPIE
jgi:hypothetical protein